MRMIFYFYGHLKSFVYPSWAFYSNFLLSVREKYLIFLSVKQNHSCWFIQWKLRLLLKWLVLWRHSNWRRSKWWSWKCPLTFPALESVIDCWLQTLHSVHHGFGAEATIPRSLSHPGTECSLDAKVGPFLRNVHFLWWRLWLKDSPVNLAKTFLDCTTVQSLLPSCPLIPVSF